MHANLRAQPSYLAYICAVSEHSSGWFWRLWVGAVIVHLLPISDAQALVHWAGLILFYSWLALWAEHADSYTELKVCVCLPLALQ